MANTQQWMDLPLISNRHIRTYFNDFVDISGGNLFLRGGSGAPDNNNCHLFINNGDISLNGRMYTSGDVSINSRLNVGLDASFNSRLFVGGDVSINSRLLVGSDTIIYGRLFVNEYQSEYKINTIINTTTTNYTLIVAQDISINGNLYLLKDASINNRLFVGGDVSFNSRLIVSSDASLFDRLFVGGDVSLNSRLTVYSDVSFNRRLFICGDVSLNNNLFVSNNFGLGVSGSLYKFDVSGTSNFRGKVNPITLIDDSVLLTHSADFDFSGILGNLGSIWTKNNIQPISAGGIWTSIATSSTGQYQLVSAYSSAVIDTDGSLYSSSNYGTTWTRVVNTTAANRSPFWSVAMSSTGKYQTAVSYNNQNSYINNAYFIYTSNNFGSTWIPTGTTYKGCYDIALSATGQYQVIVQNFDTSLDNLSIYLSSDYGTTWNRCSALANSTYLNSVAISSTGQYIVITQGNFNKTITGNIFVSNDFGITFRVVSIGAPQYWTSCAMSATGQYQYACIANINIYISIDYGVTWTASPASLSNNWKSITVSANGQYVVAAVNNGTIYTSINFGTTFQISNSDTAYWNCVAMSSDGKYIGGVSSQFTGGTLGTNGNPTALGYVYNSITPYSNIYISNGFTVYSDASFSNRILVGGVNIKGTSGNLSIGANIISNGNGAHVIGSTPNSGNLTIGGNVTINGIGTHKFLGAVEAPSFNATSDYRVKSNVVDLSSLYTVDGIRPVEYITNYDNAKNIGVIAHELQELYPFLVTGKKDGDEMQSVNYIGLIPLLINEVKSLKTKVKNLQEDMEIILSSDFTRK